MIDSGRLKACSESVVDIHYRYIARAGIQHGEQRGHSFEGGSVSDAGRHGNHGTVSKASGDRCQSALHSRYGDDHRCIHDNIKIRQQPVQSRNSDIV